MLDWRHVPRIFTGHDKGTSFGKKKKQHQQHRLTGKASYCNLYLCFLLGSDFECTMAAKEAVRRRKVHVGRRLGKVVRLKQAQDFQPGGRRWCPMCNQKSTVTLVK